MTDTKSKRVQYDWDRIEIEYRANKLSLREMAKKYGTAESTIRKRAKKFGWQRDLAKKVKVRTEEKLVRSEVRTLNAKDEEVIEEIADRNAHVVKTHRIDLKGTRELANQMLQELAENTTHHKSIEAIIAEASTDEDWSTTRRETINRAVSLNNRVAIMRDITNTIKTLQGLERTAYGIDGKENDEPTYEESLRELLDEAG